MSSHPAASIYSTFGDDPEMSDLVEMFVDEMPDRITRIVELLQAAEWDTLQCFAHQLKGSAGSYGFDAMTPLAAGLEQATRDDEPEEAIRRAADALTDALARARAGDPSDIE